ncbi:2-amino-4-hydroxy-6-hydroxymethyldihydropteridine diphosphokinase [Spirochaeta thermophila]|uniref:2-amino-4-hydroxy-6-hydroxymethyldihydropteridine pyrophosphokinase n=1 Tax=Winmispira thermophila (strain ATCC 49972 / DSM 6192 / RI 19.B1) TaxID=665571 RepID=E0RSQ9_WINT6|nr:2-amino-4-hydroxy-6-hydroxymethyldihydropteridine diphosphokinase [Spirochaeta thermophila]ADN02046.1 hypothetical protein STHERM_c11010 [Spirochaeta thermophila DSM 6192]
MATTYIAVGSNRGDSLGIVGRLLSALRKRDPELRCASLYRSEPMYLRDQPDFLNTVIEFHTDLHPEALLRFLQELETNAGRNRAEEPRYGPRPLDLDILLYDDLLLTTPSLQIPHPRMQERLFVLVPLLELAPDLVDPRDGVPFRVKQEQAALHHPLHLEKIAPLV